MAGLIGTATMIALAYLLMAGGVPVPDLAAQWGSFFNQRTYPPMFSNSWWAGMLCFGAAGVVIFPLIYKLLAQQDVVPSREMSGALFFGVLLWLLASAITAPLAGEGVFFSAGPNALVRSLTHLFAWLVYGFTFGSILQARTTPIVSHTIRHDKHDISKAA